jgi:hypothetical protein
MKTTISVAGFLLAAACCVALHRIYRSHSDLWFDYDLTAGTLNGELRAIKDRLNKLESRAKQKNVRTTSKSSR